MEVFQHRCCYRTGWVFAPHTFLRPSARRRRRPSHALPDLSYHPDRAAPRTPVLITEADWVRQLCDSSSPPELTAKQIRTGLNDLKKADLIYRCALRGLPTHGLVDGLQSRLTTWASRDRAADATELALGVCGLLPALYARRRPTFTASERRVNRRRMLLNHIRTPARLYALSVAMDEALARMDDPDRTHLSRLDPESALPAALAASAAASAASSSKAAALLALAAPDAGDGNGQSVSWVDNDGDFITYKAVYSSGQPLSPLLLRVELQSGTTQEWLSVTTLTLSRRGLLGKVTDNHGHSFVGGRGWPRVRRSLLRLAALSSTTMAFSTSRCGSLRHGVAQRFRWRHLVGMRPPWFRPTPPASGAGRPAGSECRSGPEAQAQHTNQHQATAHAAAGSTSTTNDITQAGVRGPPDWLTDLLLLAREGRSCEQDGGAGRETRLDGQLPHADPATGGVPAIRDVADTQTDRQTDRQTDTHGETK